MAPQNGSIRNYFPLVSGPSTVSTQSVSRASVEKSIAEVPASQIVIRSSDDEESDSDSSLVELADMFKSQSSGQRPDISTVKGLEAPKSARLRYKGAVASAATSPVAAKPKLKFDMKMLINQAKTTDAADASTLRVQALLNEMSSSPQASQDNSPHAAHHEILETVVAEQEGASVEQVLRAVKRTEAIHTYRKWKFFESSNIDYVAARTVPAIGETGDWKENFNDPILREQLVLSGFVNDMVTLEDTLPDEIFMWMLDEICTEPREDLRDEYGRALLASIEQIRRLILPENIMRLFRRLGAKEVAIDVHKKVRAVPSDSFQPENRDWTILRDAITFISRISEHLEFVTSSYVFCILCRMCVDDIVLENVRLLAAVQKTIVQICKNIESMYWEKKCREMCHLIFNTVDDTTLRFQILRCMPQTTSRVHELRRRLALAFLFDDEVCSDSAPQNIIDLSEIIKQLNEPQFKINKDTDYYELAALMSILDIAIDNGVSTEIDITDPEEESAFNEEVDNLATRIYIMWSSINDAGASFMSRIDAKEVMEGLRHRLIYGVRTRPKPKKSIFDSGPPEIKDMRKEKDFMHKYLKKEKVDMLIS